MAIRKSVIEQVQAKISEKIKNLETQLPASVEVTARAAAMKSLGLDKLEPKLEALRKKKQEAEKEFNEVKDQVEKSLSGLSLYGYSTGTKPLQEAIEYHGSSVWKQAVEKEKVKQLANHPVMVEIVKLRKLRGDLELKLELAASTKEVREALVDVLAQIGEGE